MQRHKQIFELTLLAILEGIIILMSFTPLGFLKIGGLEITLLTIPVAVAAITLGVKGGLIAGFTFGVTSLLQCVFGTSPFGATLLGINPVLTAIVCIVSRTLMGLLVGLIYSGLSKVIKNRTVVHIITNICAPLLNTFFFMSLLCLCFYRTDFIQDLAAQLGSTNVFMFCILFVGVNFLVEFAASFIFGFAVSRSLDAVRSKMIKNDKEKEAKKAIELSNNQVNAIEKN